MGKLSNISLSDYRRFLVYYGCVPSRITGGHEHFTFPGVRRLITLQTHVSPVPEFIIKQHLRAMGKTREDLLAFLGMD